LTLICNLLQISVVLFAGYRGCESVWSPEGTRVTRTRLVISAAICLLAVTLATVGLQRRSELAGTSHPPDFRVLGILGLAMLVGSVLLITFGPKRGAARPGNRSIWPYLVGQVVFLVILAYALRDTRFVNTILDRLHQPNSPSGQGSVGTTTVQSPDVSAWAVLTSVALLGGLLALWWFMRRALKEEETVEEDVDPEVVAAVTAAGLSAIHTTSEAREAVISCYEAMASEIGRRGIGRRATDTPTELLGRAVEAGVLKSGPPEELIGLFHIARYSQQPLPVDAVPRAVAALRNIQAGIGSEIGVGR
jgi:hypothetical protein